MVTSVASGCAAGGGAREDALWRGYRAPRRARATQSDGAQLFAKDKHLDRGAVVASVLARNPSVDAAREALRAALAEIPQASALDDPMVGYEVAPLSITGDAPFGHVVSVRQKLPFPGKRRRAGEVALAMAEVEAAEVGVVQLELAHMASELYDDYFVAARALEINAHHKGLLEQIKKSAEAQYITGRAAQQDLIQAEVELAQLERERITIDAERDQIIARLNGLLHRAPSSALPPPPADLVVASAPTGTSAELQDLALRRRPQREAASARIRAARAKIAVAERAYYPDFELMGSYNSMWDMTAHRWMVGVMIDVPIQRGKRHAAVNQAEAEIAGAQFQDSRLVDDIRVEVDRALRRVAEAQALVDVYVNKLLPASRARVDSARAGFTAAQSSFLAVVEAQKTLREIELSLAMTRAELSRRRAALARVVGFVPGLPERGTP
ncbi:MAG: TolC family protein [Deltaproteobacteria bacterium]|nr:TolC family protein [Deltaproteobacteria bacterium]MDQ3295706.1 TolC family protein [Myxococcota bacterium]